MTLAWVIGRGGLLGSAVSRALARNGTLEFVPGSRFAWHDENALQGQIEEATDAFIRVAAAARRWEIYWAAGVGTMNSGAADLVVETRALAALLGALADSARRRALRAECGSLSLASSAGAVYAGAGAALIDESAEPAPTGTYARAKLDHEAMVAAAATETGMSAGIARFSTLYGAGQSRSKAQGLLTHIARCIVRNRALQIFVPLDTIRDYIVADDAASMWIEAARHSAQPGCASIKIVASEQPATIAEILSLFKRVARRPPRVVTSVSPASGIYSRRMQFRSRVAPLNFTRPKTPLLIGISRVLEAERVLYVASSAASDLRS